MLHARRIRRILLRLIEGAFHMTDADAGERQRSVPGERRREAREVLAIGAVQAIEDERAILDAAAHRTELVHRPRKRHGSAARDATEGRAQSGDAVPRRWAGDRPERFTADTETNEPRCGG